MRRSVQRARSGGRHGATEERGELTRVMAAVGFHSRPQREVGGAVIRLRPLCFLPLCSLTHLITSQGGESERAQCCAVEPQGERGV